ncbi:MAG: sensor histidine kinase [Kordiimonadales bacterium]|nr:MAG: sensor histidine kinase [Kordiimonadales bacterium]
MFEAGWSTIGLIVVIAVAVLLWFGLSLYGFWRAGRMTDRARSLQDLTSFLDTMIKTDHRFPIWIWPDGRLQADSGALALVGLPDTVSDLSDLAGSDGIGLPRETIDQLRAGLEEGQVVPTPLVVHRGANQSRLIIDMQWLPSKDARWPHGIMWLEESLDHLAPSGKKSVRALELRWKDLVRAFNSLPYPVWSHGIDGQLQEANHAYVSAVDAENITEVTTRGLQLFGHGGRSVVAQARATGSPVRERRFGVIDGQRRAFTVTHTPIDDNGTILSIAVDVTGEEEALSELSRVLESQSETLNRLRSPVAIFGSGQTLRFYNSAFARLSQVSEDALSSEIVHSELLDLMRDQRRLPEQIDFPKWKAGILKHYTDLLEPFEEMWHLPDGTAHRVVTQPHPLGGLLILFEDVTDRLALERSYNTLIAVQQETLDNMHEGIAVFGTDGRLQLSNPAFKEIWHLNESEISGRPHLTAFVEAIEAHNELADDKEHFISDLAALVAERKHKTGRLRHKNGRVVDVAIVPLPDGGVMLTQSDITDTFKVEQALRERSNALEAADRLKSEFITNMSYELRTPLNSIFGFAEMLDQRIFGDLNDHQADYIRNILTAAGELKELISSVLDLAVIEAGEVRLEIARCNVAEVLREAAGLAQDLARKVDISLVLDPDIDVGVIQADERRLKQAFYNMASTMLSFARYGGELTIDLEGNKDHIRVAITNEDSGLAPRERDRLIAAVEMGASPGVRRTTGLDLSLVRSIVGLHGGGIDLAPYQEEGLILSCSLPREQPEMPDPEQLARELSMATIL